MTVKAADIISSLDVTGVASIPNQIHHEARSTRHIINIALIGDEGLGKTAFLNRCLKQSVFTEKSGRSAGEVEIRVRQANLVEAGFKASLSLIDVPRTSLSWDRQTAYKALIQYGEDQLNAYEELTSRVERQVIQPRDGRISVALFFVNGLTSRCLSTLELGALAELSRLTKVIIVIGKADGLLPQELAHLKSNIQEQIKDTGIELFTPTHVFAVSKKETCQAHFKEDPFDSLLFKYRLG